MFAEIPPVDLESCDAIVSDAAATSGPVRYRMTLRLGAHEAAALATLARANGRTASEEMRLAMRAHLAAAESRNDGAEVLADA